MADNVPSPGLSDKELRNFLKWSEDKLPPALLKMILDYTGVSPISSILHIVYTGTVSLLQQVVLGPNRKSLCPIARYMTFNFVFIEESWSWCGCKINTHIIGYEGGKTITANIPSGINTVRFTVGCFGIQGLQFLGPDGASGRIGEFHESLWVGEMTSSNSLQHLLLGFDVR
jgi:hypothetical protein